MDDLAGSLQAQLTGIPPAEQAVRAKDWCVGVGIPELERRRDLVAEASGDLCRRWLVEVEGVLALVAALPGDQGGLEYVRPLLAQAAAILVGRTPSPPSGPGALAALGRYVRAVPPGEALGFVVDWAVQAWAEASVAGREMRLAVAAVQLAALTISRVMVDVDNRAAYGEAAQAARDLFTGLAGVAPPAERQSVAESIERAPEHLASWGFESADAARIGTLARICRDFGRSLPAGGRYPGADLLL